MNPLLMGIAGNAVGSYLLGQQQREAKLEDQKLKQQQLKMLMEAQKLKDAKEERAAAAEERKATIFNQIFGQELAGGQQPTGGATAPSSGLKFGDTFGSDSSSSTQPKPQSKILDVLSDPLKAAVLKEMTGVDFLGAVNSTRQAGAEQRQMLEFLYRMQNDQTNRQMHAGQGTWSEVDTPDGGKQMVFRPSNPAAASRYGAGGGLGAVPPMMPGQPNRPPQIGGAGTNYSKIPEAQKPLAVDELPMWRHPDNKRPQPGLTAEQAKQQGFVRFTATDAPKLDMLENGIDVLNTVENLMLAANIPTSGESSRLPGLVRAGKAGMQIGREGQALAKLRDFIDGNKSTIARIAGEVGNLAAQEQEDVKASLGRISDAGPKAWEQFNLVKQKFMRIKARKYGLMPDKVPDGVDMILNPITNKLEPAK